MVIWNDQFCRVIPIVKDEGESEPAWHDVLREIDIANLAEKHLLD
jgi:hypothetical protein